MANVYIRSGAAGTGSGADWTNAAVTITAGIVISAAGDSLWVADDHAETSASIIAQAFKGTAVAPNTCLCVNHLGSVPPVSADLRTTATVTYSGTATNGILTSGDVYVYGISFFSGTTAASNAIVLANANPSTQRFDSCLFALTGASGTPAIVYAATTAGRSLELVNTPMSFALAVSAVQVGMGFVWRDTPNALAGAAVPTTLFGAGASGNANVWCEGLDLSAAGAGKTLVGATAGGPATSVYNFVNCKLGASVTVAATPTARSGPITIVSISDSANTTYNQQKYLFEGTLTTTTTNVRTGGATDGTTPIAWKVVSTSGSNWWDPFECFEIVIWNTITGVSKTASVAMLSSATLTTANVWAEAQYLGNASFPICSLATGGTADVLATGSNWALDAGSTWNTSGVSTPVQQTLSVTFTPQQVGWIRVKVKVAIASTTLFIDPLVTVV